MNFVGRIVITVLTSSLIAVTHPNADGRQLKRGPDLRPIAHDSNALTLDPDGVIRCVTVAEFPGLLARDAAGGRVTRVVRGTGNITFEVRFGDGYIANPIAMAAFERAVAIWCSLVEAPSPVTLVMDADFAPTVFGSTIPLGQARIQPLIGVGEYSQWRSALVKGASSGRDLALFGNLPEDAVPTDLGPTDTFVMPSTVLRVAGLLPAITDPAAEVGQYGAPPATAIKNDAPWDFDPDNGIASNKVDFVGVALHEIGHVIGFATRCGTTETNPNAPLTVSAFDVYRVRPGVTRTTFSTTSRIMTAGGEQVHFSDGSELALSTARLNLTGGDGFSGDHWKDDMLTGVRLGIMDPQQALGQMLDVTSNDVQALRAMGFHVVGEARDRTPFATLDTGELNGTVLTLSGRVHDIDGDVESVTITLKDAGGVVLRDEIRDIATSGQRIATFDLNVPDLDDLPQAVSAELVFSDTSGSDSDAVEISFTEADDGGPIIRMARFNGRRLTLRGNDLLGASVHIEINAVATGAPDVVSRKKIRIDGTAAELNLRPGPNRIRVIRDGLRSNAVMVTL